MTLDPSVLELRPAVLRREFQDGNVTRYPESHYLDFVVDGRALGDVANAGPDVVTLLNRAWLPTVADSIKELLGERPVEGLTQGRIALLVCGVCGDLACAAVTASLRFDAESVTWSDFAWENGYEAADPISETPESLTFNRHQYQAAFEDAFDRVAELPYDELAHVGRKFLWPWQWGWRLPRD